MINLNIFIIEYASAIYGCIKGYEELLPEGFSMAYSLASVIKPYYNAILIVSENLPIDIRGVDYVRIKCRDIDRVLTSLSRDGYVVVIAPPKELIDLCRVIGDRLIGPSFKYIVLFSNKYDTMVNLGRCNLNIPYTVGITNVENLDISTLAFPIVVKPSMLAGSECVYLITNLDELKNTVSMAIKCDPSNSVVIQKYINGVPSSISAVLDRGRIVFYSVNIQLIAIDNNRFKYIGNILPIRNKDVIDYAYRLLTHFTSCFPDYVGYIGFDTIITKNGLTIVEVNPRITTSFIAISQLYPLIGRMIIEVSRGVYRYGEPIYLGDMVDGIGYVFILDRDIGIGNKIFSHGSKYIVMGIAKNMDDILAIIDRLGYRGIVYDYFKSF